MSDLLAVEDKTREGSEWRGYIDVEVDGETRQLCHRLLLDDEQAEIMSLVGKEKFADIIETLREAVEKTSEDEVERYQELVEKQQDGQDLTAAEEVELEELEDDLGDTTTDVLAFKDADLVRGTHKAVEYGIVPDDDDIDRVLDMSFEAQEERWGERAKTRGAAYDLLKESAVNLTKNSTDDTAHSVGFKVLLRSITGEGN